MMKSVLLFLIRFYQAYLSQILSILTGSVGQCRFETTCSVYAAEVIQKHGAVKGSYLSIQRLFSCQPYGPIAFGTKTLR